MQGIVAGQRGPRVGDWGMDSVAEANDGAFRDLLRKKMEQESMQREADQLDIMTVLDFGRRGYRGDASSVVSSSTHYADNTVYQDINKGLDPRIDVRNCIHPLSPDECDICVSLVEQEPNCCLVSMPNHCINSQGNIEGFKFQCREGSKASVLPICREMYFRHSMVECVYPEKSALDSAGENVQVLAMIMRQSHVLEKLVLLVQRIHAEGCGHEASFECMPENDVDGSDPRRALSQRTSDNKEWRPEMPRMVGIFHAYVKDINRGVRLHKLFISVSGGCTKAADKLFNMFIDVQDRVTSKDFVESEESWYLNSLNQRSNARVLDMVAKEFGLDIPTMVDAQAYTDKDRMAQCCTESTINSMHRDPRTGLITVTSGCMDPRMSRNGVLCSIHPTQGMCLFKGPVATNQVEMVYGGGFGHDTSTGPSCFPTKLPLVSKNYSFRCKPPGGSVMHGLKMPISRFTDTSVLARLDENGARVKGQVAQDHTSMDEAMIRRLSGLQWNRDNGMVELMPIAIVVTGAD